MRTILTLAFIAAGLSSPARAVIIGNSAGYLIDHEKTYLTARVGGEFYSGELIRHIGEFEIGYVFDSGSGVETEVLPMTLNYRIQFGGDGLFAGCLGIGAGMVRYEVSDHGARDDSWAPAGQGFAGLSIRLFKKGRIDLGARYLRLRDVELLGRRVADGDDIAIEAGFHFQF